MKAAILKATSKTIIVAIGIALLLGLWMKLALNIPFTVTFWLTIFVMALSIYKSVWGPFSALTKITGVIALLAVTSATVLQQSYPYRQKHHTFQEYDQTLHEEGLSGFFKQ